MQLHSRSVKCQDGQAGAAASGRRSRFDRAESVAAADTADAAVVNHCFIQIGTVHFRRSGVLEYVTIFDPSRPCSLLSDDRALHTDDSWSPEVDAGDLPPPPSGGRCDGSWPRVHSAWLRVGRPLLYIASRPVAVSDRASPGAPRRLALVPPSLRLPQQLGVGEDAVTGPTSSASTDVHRS